jgi:hypothetical protein
MGGWCGSGVAARRALTHSPENNNTNRAGCRQGDGRTFPRNPKSEELLARLAKELVEVDRQR